MLNFIQNFVGKGKFEVSLNSKNEYYFKLKSSISFWVIKFLMDLRRIDGGVNNLSRNLGG